MLLTALITSSLLASPLEIRPYTTLSVPEGIEIFEGETLPGRRSPGTIFYQGKLYVVGGHTAEDAHDFYYDTLLNNLQIYDPLTRTWSEGAPKPSPGRFSSLAAHKNHLFAFGGFVGTTPKLIASYDSIERYDIDRNEWTVLDQTLFRSRSQHSVVTLNNKAYLIGGWSSEDLSKDIPDAHEKSFIREIEVFDLVTQTLQARVDSLPETGRRGFSAVVWNGKIIISGGFGERPGSFLGSVIAFDPEAADSALRWTNLPSLPHKMIFPQILAMEDGLYLIGGTLRDGQLEESYVLRPHSNAWEKIEFPTFNNVERTLVPIDSTNWLMVGGRFFNDKLNPAIDLVSLLK
jgi:hypothetical protein